jgi:hypothetical protein
LSGGSQRHHRHPGFSLTAAADVGKRRRGGGVRQMMFGSGRLRVTAL